MEERSTAAAAAAAPSPGPSFQVSKFSSSGNHGKRRDRLSRWEESSKKSKGGGDSPGFQRGRDGKFRGHQNRRHQHQHHHHQQQQQQQQQQQHDARIDGGDGGGGGDFNHLGMLLVNQIVMLDGSVRSYYSLPPDYPMPPDFRLVFPPEFAPVEGVWTAAAAAPAAPPYHPGVIVDAGYQPQFVAPPRHDEINGGSSQQHQRKRSQWNRHKN